jgi:succinoglycan biosynthesis transport protein ExoP
MNLSHFLAVIRARWVSALIVFAVVLAATILYLVFATRVYTATASLLIDVKPDPVSSMLYGGTNPSLINTQIEIIRSDRVAQRVAQNLKLADLADMRAAWAGAKSGLTIQEWLTELVENGLDPKVVSPGSNVITIGYHSADPRFAATAANAYVQAYLETSIELRVDPARQYSGFFTDQQKSAREALETAQNKLSAFQKEKGIIGTDDKFDLEMSRRRCLHSARPDRQRRAVVGGARQRNGQRIEE